MNTGSFIVYIEPDDIYVDIAKDIEARLDTFNYELENWKKWKCYEINERWIRWENNDIVCRIETKHI